MDEISKSKSLTKLNFASNEIGNEGMIAVFQGLLHNESVISLNLSTIEGVARNRISASGVAELKNLLIHNKFLENLDLSSIGLGNLGLEAICDALAANYNQPSFGSFGASKPQEDEKPRLSNI